MGTAAEWFTVVVAAVAVVLAWKASSRSNALQAELVRLENERENRAEQREAERRLESERAAQADLVAVWPELTPGPTLAFPGSRPFTTEPSWRVVVSNASALPVYDVEVMAMGPEPDRIRGRAYVGIVTPAEPVGVEFPSFDPEERVSTTADQQRVEHLETEADLSVGVRFRDTAGRRWARNGDGVLMKESDPIA